MKVVLKNFCIEPSSRECSCTRDIRCGGIIEASLVCVEHGDNAPAQDVLRTHNHPVQAAVGTAPLVRYDDAKAAS